MVLEREGLQSLQKNLNRTQPCSIFLVSRLGESWTYPTRSSTKKFLVSYSVASNVSGDDPDRVQILKGWFSDTLPKAPIEEIALLRLDGDLYDSTMDALNVLYDKVSIGGYIYVDDYGSFAGCKLAIDEFRHNRNITDTMNLVMEKGDGGEALYEAVWWRKRK